MAELAGEAGRVLGLPDAEVAHARRAGLVHDLGRLGVSNAIWEKPGPLGAGEWERIRMHPYLTERILCQSVLLGRRRAGQRGGRPLGASSPVGFFLRDMLDTGRPAVRRYASASSRRS